MPFRVSVRCFSRPDLRPPCLIRSFSQCPSVYATDPSHAGAWPQRDFRWSPEQFTLIAGSLVHWTLCHRVGLPTTGPVWRPLNRQLIDLLREAGYDFAGYDYTHEPEAPTQCPWVLLTVGPVRGHPGLKVHAPFDDFTAATFTLDALLGARFTGVGFPFEGELSGLPFIHVCESDVSCH